MSSTSRNITAEFIDDPEGIRAFIDHVESQKANAQPFLYIDLEGVKLSRDGTVCLLTVLLTSGPGRERFYLIDIQALQHSAFTTINDRGTTLKDILEDPEILKVFFDVRNDSDALYAHYFVKLEGIRDVQLMESATRTTTPQRKLISGLSRCIEATLAGQEKLQWKRSKDDGEKLWNPEKGGSYSVFEIRPLSAEVLAYCVGDVQYLPRLYRKYKKGTERWNALIAQASQDRVLASQHPGYMPHGRHKALSSWTPEQNTLLDSWSEVGAVKDYGYYDDY